jgi:hypothetical protein
VRGAELECWGEKEMVGAVDRLETTRGTGKGRGRRRRRRRGEGEGRGDESRERARRGRWCPVTCYAPRA